MMRVAALLVAVASAAAPSHADSTVTAVHTDLGEARACFPIAGGALVGTGGGLAKVGEGGDIRQIWTASSGLPGTRIETIVRAGDQLWVGTDAGAARVSLANDALKIEQLAGDRGVRDVAKLGGKTYLATWGGGVRVVGGGQVGYRVASKQLQRLNVTSLAVVGNTLYAGTAIGLYRLANGTLDLVADDAVPKGAAISALLADGGRLYIGTAAGLFVREADKAKLVGEGDIRRIVNAGGAILVARLGEGIARIDRGRLTSVDKLPRGLVMAQTIGSDGGALCAGGIDGAWLRARTDAAWVKMATHAGPPSNDISALAVDGDRLWVGTFDRGLAVRERGAWRTSGKAKLDGRINAILVEKRANQPSKLWVGTASGLYSIVGDDVSRLARADGLPSRGVLSLAALRDGRLLVGTSAGAVILGTGRPVRLAKGQDLGNVWAVGEDGSGALWLGTTTGLYRGTETGTEWKRYAVASGHLRDDWVMGLAFAKARDKPMPAILVGTYHGGVTRLELDGGTATATQLGDGWVNPGGVVLDGERLLASTMDGLFAGDGKSPPWTKQARLPGKDVTAAVRIGGTLFVATRRGLAELR